LLAKLSYDASRDYLLHLGDFIAKGPNSQQLLSQFSDTNVTGVRGNHEQKVIEWRGWIEWVKHHSGGQDWLEELERKYSKGLDPEKNKHMKWRIPKKWMFMEEHYKIARDMSETQYSYLKSLPLVIHLPSLHAHAVHAGILPFNPKYAPDAPKQPLARPPKPTPTSSNNTTRYAQERTLLTQIAQNTDPWVLLNMRSVLDNGEVTRDSTPDTPWTELWTMAMKQCRGFSDATNGRIVRVPQAELAAEAFRLSCLPISVVYGHAASRGLDIKRWSFGLDTACVKGKRLTAMLVSNLTLPLLVEDAETREIPFGEHGKAQLVSVSCSKP
ncbi:Metallo-dependent phosphatase, partial [Ramaria rubella]